MHMKSLSVEFLGDRLENGSPYAIGPLSVSVCLSVCLSVPSVGNVGVLWPNGRLDCHLVWMYRPRPGPHRVRWGPSSPPKRGTAPKFSTHVCCGQTAGRIKMPLGTELGLGPGDMVLDGNPRKGAQHPLFGPCLLWPNGRPSQQLLSSCYLSGAGLPRLSWKRVR